MIALRRFSARPVHPARKSNAPPLMDVIVGRFISVCCLLLAGRRTQQLPRCAALCGSAIVAAAWVARNTTTAGLHQCARIIMKRPDSAFYAGG